MANKIKTTFVCQECGAQAPKWLGRCPECQAWNSYIEESLVPASDHSSSRQSWLEGTPPEPLSQIQETGGERLVTRFEELNRVLGGGIVKGSIILVGGEPGIGKSTLLMQIAADVAKTVGTVLYVSGEESAPQVKMRAVRLGALSSSILMMVETRLSAMVETIQKIKPAMVVVDSIQTVYQEALISAPGSVSQVREGASRLMQVAKSTGIPIILVGHVTKEGQLAGPRVLEHIMDTVLSLEGDRDRMFRIMRSYKNRFGATNEIAVFEMRQEGLVEVGNLSAHLLSERMAGASGSAVVGVIEGTRPLFVEVQALVAPSYFGTPQRRTSGVDANRVSLLLAVLEKRTGLQVGHLDVFVNVAGGFRVVEPSVDLGVLLAIASSFRDKPLPLQTVVMGEVGLAGEVRAVSQLDRRIYEAERLGFKTVVTHADRTGETSTMKLSAGINVESVDTVQDALDRCFT